MRFLASCLPVEAPSIPAPWTPGLAMRFALAGKREPCYCCQDTWGDDVWSATLSLSLGAGRKGTGNGCTWPQCRKNMNETWNRTAVNTEIWGVSVIATELRWGWFIKLRITKSCENQMREFSWKRTVHLRDPRYCILEEEPQSCVRHGDHLPKS